MTMFPPHFVVFPDFSCFPCFSEFSFLFVVFPYFIRTFHMMRFSPLFLVPLLLLAGCIIPSDDTPPNIILVITDDQGYGDFGFTGNPILQTPNLDQLATESIQVNPFYVSPVCAPTRASLMTGRYNYRTRVVDTWVGRAMMEPDEDHCRGIAPGRRLCYGHLREVAPWGQLSHASAGSRV